MVFAKKKALETAGYVLAGAALCSLALGPCTAVADAGMQATSKDETVRVTANADGTPVKTEVTDVLKNGAGAARIADLTNLSDVKADDEDVDFTREGDAYVWNADGSDVTYTGTTSETLPVTLSVEFTLDGTRVSADGLAGRSGHVAISYRFSNNSAANAEIRGATETIYTPFTAITALMFDSDALKNIQVSSGRVIQDGDTSIVVGYAMPGLTASLGELGEGLELDDGFSVEGDASAFEMKSGLTLISAGLFSDVDVDGLATGDLGEAADALDQAAGTLAEGSKALGEGLAALSKGAAALREGNEALAAGVSEAASGIGQVGSGAEALDSAAGALATGAGRLYTGTKSLQDALSQAKAVSSQVSSGLVALSDGSLRTLLAEAEKETQANIAVLDVVKAEAEGATKDLDSVKAQIDDALSDIVGTDSESAAARASLGEAEDALRKAQSQLADIGSKADALSTGAARQAADALSKADLASLASASEQLASGLAEAEALIGNESASSTLIAGAYAVKSGAEALESGLDAFASNSQSFSGSVGAIVSGAAQLADGARQLDSGTKALEEGSAALADGMQTFRTEGVQALSRELDKQFGGLIDRINALSEASNGYDTFGGKAPETPGTVKFVIETAPISKS